MRRAPDVLVLIATRMGVVLSFLFWAIVIQVWTGEALYLTPLFHLCAATLVLTLGYLGAYAIRPDWRVHPAFVLAQLSGDCLLVGVLVALTGGASSLFSLLFLLVIVLGGFYAGRQGAYLTAYLSVVAFVSVAAVLQFNPDQVNALANMHHVPAAFERFLQFLFVQVLAIALTGWLAGQIAKRQSAVHEELAETQEDLARLQALHLDIIRSMDSGLAVVGRDGRIAFHNARWGTILQPFARDAAPSMEGRAFKDIRALAPESRALLESQKRVTVRVAPEGETQARWLGASSTALRDTDGRPAGTLILLQDITEIKAMEEEVQSRERLATVGTMSAGLAHEIRNPLASIAGSVQLLAQSPSLPQDQRNLLNIIREESERLHRFLGDFLTLAKPRPPVCVHVPLRPMLEEVARLAAGDADADRIQVVVQDGPEVTAWCDAGQIRQVIWNLAQNARRAVQEGPGETGVVTLSVHQEEAGHALLVVEDNGIGMDDDAQRHLFDPFWSGFQKGIGLGMAIVSQIVEAHRGTMRIRSAPGQGTRIVLDLPPGPADQA